MSSRTRAAAIIVTMMSFFLPGVGCGKQTAQMPLVDLGSPAVPFPGSPAAGPASRPADDDEVPGIARTDEELAVLLSRFDAGSKDREIEFYRGRAEFWKQKFRECMEASFAVQSAMEEHERAATQPGLTKDEDVLSKIDADNKLDMARRRFRSTFIWDDFGMPNTWPEVEMRTRRRYIKIHQNR